MKGVNEHSGLAFGDWQYWPDSGLLISGQQQVTLSTQLNQVLSLLVRHQPDMVSRQHFLDQVWKDKYVNEDALSRTIAELRKILGDSATQAKYIKTLPKKGYALAQVVEPIKIIRTRRWQLLAWLVVLFVLIMTLLAYTQKDSVAELQEAVVSAVRVTAKPGLEQQSALSADGQWLVYSRNTTQQSQIIIENIKDANQQRVIELPRHRLASPLYLPQQQQVIFTAQDRTQCYLKSYDLHSELFTDISDCVYQGESRTVGWNETQQQLLYSMRSISASKLNTVAIHQYDMNTQQILQLTFPENDQTQDWDPKVSPDGQWLSFTRGNESVRNIWLKNLHTDELKQMTTGEHYSVSHAWYDNEYLVYDSDQSGSRQLWLMAIDDAEPHLIGANGAQHPSFDSKRTTMTFQAVSYEANIWAYDVIDSGFKRLVHSTKYDNNPAFSPDGQSFAFSSNRQDQGSIWIYDLGSQQERQVVAVNGAKLTRPSWSEDGRSLIITKNDAQGYASWVYDLASQSLHKIPFSQPNMGASKFQGTYYALSKSLSHNNQIISLSQGKETVLPLKGVSRFMVLDDGRLVFSKVNQNGLHIFDQTSAQKQLLTPMLRKTAMNLWTAVNQSVYFDVAGDMPGIYRLDVDTGMQTWVTEHRPFSVGTSLSVNDQQDIILITRTDRAESDILKAKLN